jgi:hypothetical protein
MTKRKGPKPDVTDVELQKALNLSNVEFFRAILSDEAEKDLWYMFMIGRQPKRGEDGQYLMDENGCLISEEIDVNPVQLKAFLRAVEYKRGQPVSVDPNQQAQSGIKVTFECVGAAADFFKTTGKESGLIK